MPWPIKPTKTKYLHITSAFLAFLFSHHYLHFMQKKKNMRKRKVTYVEDVTIEFVGSGKSLLMVVVQLRKVVASSGSRLKLLEMKNVALERLKVPLPKVTSLVRKSLRCCCYWRKAWLWERMLLVLLWWRKILYCYCWRWR